MNVSVFCMGCRFRFCIYRVHSLSSLLGGCVIPSFMRPFRRMSLLKSPAIMILCVGWCCVRILIWSLISGIRCMSSWCEGMYRFIMSIGDSGLLVILMICR